jgi:hypothetical protein
MPYHVTPTLIEGVLVLEPKVFGDVIAKHLGF